MQHDLKQLLEEREIVKLNLLDLKNLTELILTEVTRTYDV